LLRYFFFLISFDKGIQYLIILTYTGSKFICIQWSPTVYFILHGPPPSLSYTPLQRRVRRIENDRFWVFTKSPWNLFIPCVNVTTNPSDLEFTHDCYDDRRVIELTSKSPVKCLNWRGHNKMQAVIGKVEKRKSKPINLTNSMCWNHI